MKRWPIVIIMFYVLAVVGQSYWFYLMTSVKYGVKDFLVSLVPLSPSLVIVVGGGLMLMAVRVEIKFQRLQARRSIVVPAIAACLLFLILVFSGLMSLTIGIWGDNFFNVLFEPEPYCYYFFLSIGVVWCVWAWVFYRYFKARGTESFVWRALNWLLAGSVLELLVAVPSHIISCRRNDCCASGYSFWGITIGLSIMLLSLGPGIVFLYMERIARKKRRESAPESTIKPNR